MLCEHCHKKIIHKRHFWNFFTPETNHLCEACYQKYPLLPADEVIPIQQGIMHLFTMIIHQYPVLPSCYQSFYQPYYLTFLKHKHQFTLLIFDTISEVCFTLLDQLSFGDLWVIRLYENSHEKGENL